MRAVAVSHHLKTRATLLTGHNVTTVGRATIEECTDAFSNCNGWIPADTTLLS